MDDAKKKDRSQVGHEQVPRSQTRVRERIGKSRRKLMDLHRDDPVLIG